MLKSFVESTSQTSKNQPYRTIELPEVKRKIRTYQNELRQLTMKVKKQRFESQSVLQAYPSPKNILIDQDLEFNIKVPKIRPKEDSVDEKITSKIGDKTLFSWFKTLLNDEISVENS